MYDGSVERTRRFRTRDSGSRCLMRVKIMLQKIISRVSLRFMITTASCVCALAPPSCSISASHPIFYEANDKHAISLLAYPQVSLVPVDVLYQLMYGVLFIHFSSGVAIYARRICGCAVPLHNKPGTITVEKPHIHQLIPISFLGSDSR